VADTRIPLLANCSERPTVIRIPVIAFLLFCVFAAPATAALPESQARIGPDARVVPMRLDARTRAVLDAALQRDGQARVIVGLRADWSGDRTASAPGSAAGRATVARLQDSVLDSLRHPRGVRRYRNFAFLSLEVDALELERLLSLPEVVSVRADSLLSPHLDRSAPQIGADAVWAMGFRGAGEAVAVLDSGVDSAHSALAGKVVAEACFSTTSPGFSSVSVCPAGTNPGGSDQQFGAGAATPCTVDGCDHGTHVAGTAAGNDSTYTGVAPDAAVLAVQVFSRFNSSSYCGSLGTPCILSFLSDLLAGLDWVYDQRDSYSIASANMSLGGGGYSSQSECDAYFPSLTSMISTLRGAGIAAVMSSGNDGYTNRIGHPGCISDGISVGAVTLSDAVASFSNSASWLDLLAPGTSIDAPVPGGGFARKQGTSMAAPHVAGAFALLRSAGATGSVDELLAALKSTGVPIIDARNEVTTPRIQVNEAVLVLVGGATGGADVVLIPDQIDTGQYGHRWGTDQNEVEVVAAFQNIGVDFELSVAGHDIDTNTEISVHLNGTQIGYLSKGPNDELNAGDTFQIPAASQQNGTNEVTFRQRTPGWIWGVTNLLLVEAASPVPPGVDLVLVPGVQDDGQYGHRWGTDQNEVEVVAAFRNIGVDFELSVTGHDIDTNTEISVHLNGTQIGFLSKGPNDELNAGDTFVIPASIQAAGDNRVVFRQRSPGWIWGVTALLLTDTSPAEPPPTDLTLIPGQMDTGQYGWRWGNNAHRETLTAGFQSTGADFEFQVTAYDMDRNDEITVFLNGNLLGYLSKGPNDAFNAGNTFPIPATLQRAGDNVIEFRQRTPGWIWGVTNLLLTPTTN
jgi:hypothetical protein